MAEPDVQPSVLTIPNHVWLTNVLPLLHPKELLRLAATCSSMMQLIGSDAVWQPLCEARGWGPATAGSCLACFSSHQKTLCVQCGTHTRYAFKLLGCRLCEACEHAHPRFTLVTALEAQQRLGLPLEQLRLLPHVDSCGVQLYLQDAVIKLLGGGEGGGAGRQRGGPPGAGGTAAAAAAAGSQYGSDSDQEAEEEEEQEEGAGGASAVRSAGQGASSSDGDGDEVEEGQEGEGLSRGRQGDDKRAAAKAERKAAKKQAKLEQRLKREAKAAGVRYTPSTPIAMATTTRGKSSSSKGSRPGSLKQPQSGSSVGGHGAGSWGGRQRPGAQESDESDGEYGRQQGGRRQGGTPGQGKPGKGSGSGHQFNARRANRMQQGLYPEGAHAPAATVMPSSSKATGWLKEREQIMREWGQYALSGLVLADE